MNDFQILRQLAKTIRGLTWSGGEPLFQVGSVVISKELPEVLAARLSMPICIIAPAEPQTDPEFGEEPGLVQYGVQIIVFVKVPGDSVGTSVLLGANRTDAAAAGKGAMEIAAPLLAGIRCLTDDDGIRIIGVHKGGSGHMQDSDAGWLGWAEHRFDVLGTDAKWFPPPRRFRGTASGSGNASLLWTLPPTARFDYRRCILRRASGSTPPGSATSGTGVSLGGSPDGASATSVTDNPGAGTWSYSLFAAYNDYAVTPGSRADAPTSDLTAVGDKDYSAAATITGLVVT